MAVKVSTIWLDRDTQVKVVTFSDDDFAGDLDSVTLQPAAS
jgi:hypothetical protein